MQKTLRPYQQTAIQECLSALKQSSNPVLLMASVGSGKSLMISELLLLFEKKGKRALCLVNNAELIRNNAATFKEQGGNPSVYCAALGEKDISTPIVFGTPQSVLNGIKKNETIGSIKFNIIVVDEAHAISHNNHQSSFMRILRHYKTEYPDMRVLGATGTNFRFKGDSIVGSDCLFKTQVGNITTAWLIEQGYLVQPQFEIDENAIDFSSVRKNSMGQFSTQQMETILAKNQRLTGQILTHLQEIMTTQNRFGCFIFCCTRRHCIEAMDALPTEQTAIITGETPQKVREIILNKARNGEIKYLINVQVLTVGIDVPPYDTLLFLRPTESLVLAVQMIGRALRLSPNKSNALILDCAGNIERHSDWDDPIILSALEQTRDADKPLIFPCPICDTMNSEHARRCVGMHHSKRCDFYFEFKECHSCQNQNDIAARMCRHCECELIDPNAKLKPLDVSIIEVEVLESKYWIQEYEGKIRFSALYTINHNMSKISENYSPMASEKAKNLFYGKFVKESVNNSSYWYPHLTNAVYLKAMLKQINSPISLRLRWDGQKWSIWKKVFACNEESLALPPQNLHTKDNNILETPYLT